MEQAYLAYKKACNETVDGAALGEYLNVHQELQTELEAAHGERYGALVPTDVSGWPRAGVATLPTKGKIWYIHCATFVPPAQGPYLGSWGSIPSDTTQAWVIDNYGNLEQLYNYHPYSGWASSQACNPKPSPGGYAYLYPLSKKQIDHVKTLPTQGSLFESPMMTLQPILKSWAEENFQRKAAELRQSREILALQAELRAIKSTSPPLEDLLGITETAALPAVKSTAVFKSTSSPLEDLLGITEASALPAVKSTAVFNTVEDASLLDT
jgi:hypothetical protein